MSKWLLNSDVGEGMPHDAELMQYLDLCSIACGGHSGDEQSFKATVTLAKKHHVKIGAHPSYPDRENFGRKSMSLPPHALKKALEEQLQNAWQSCKDLNVPLHHIKAHGALYHDISSNATLAKLFLSMISEFSETLLILPPAGEATALAIKAKLPHLLEGFADRRYTPAGSLVPRNHPEAVITSPEASLEQVNQISTRQVVTAVGGDKIPLRVHTFCIHGDNPSCVAIAKNLSQSRA